MAKIELSIVIVNWNVAGLLADCLNSIRAHLTDLHHEVIVVDNASSDGSTDMLRRDFPWVTTIANDENTGFATACNQGANEARGRYLLLLNPDTLLKAHTVMAMMEILDGRPEVAIVGPRVVEEDGTVVRACHRPFTSLWEIAKGLFLTDKLAYWSFSKLLGRRFVAFANRRFYRSGPVHCIQGSCMLLRRNEFLAMGGFDERVPLYLDDGDLCYRIHRAGKTVYFYADGEIVHHGARSVGKMENQRLSSLVGCLAIDAFFLKHRGLGHVAVYHAMLLFSSIVFIPIDLLLWVLLVFTKRRFVTRYLIKHLGTLRYSLTFRFHTNALPKSWPRSIWRAYRQKS